MTCPDCHGIIEQVPAERLQTWAPAFATSLDDLYYKLTDVQVLACTSCEWCIEAPRKQL